MKNEMETRWTEKMKSFEESNDGQEKDHQQYPLKEWVTFCKKIINRARVTSTDIEIQKWLGSEADLPKIIQNISKNQVFQ